MTIDMNLGVWKLLNIWEYRLRVKKVMRTMNVNNDGVVR